MALSAETAKLAAKLTEVTPDLVLVVELLPDIDLLPVNTEPVLVVRLLLDIKLLLNVALLPTVEPGLFPDA